MKMINIKKSKKNNKKLWTKILNPKKTLTDKEAEEMINITKKIRK